MTYEEAKSLLADMRAAKRWANTLKARIADLESDYACIRSSLSGDGLPHGNMKESRVEQMAIRVAAEREKHIAALEVYFALEDKLAVAIEMLDPIEQEIILGYYLDGKSNWRLARDLNYDERTIRRKKNKAIQILMDLV